MRKYTITTRTPFFASQKYVGMEPKDCLVISKMDFDRMNYGGDDTLIIFNIDYDFISEHIIEKRCITIGKIKQLLKDKKAKKRMNSYMNDYGININRNDCDIYTNDMGQV